MQGERRGKLYDTDVSDMPWAIVAPQLPSARPGGRSRTTCLCSVLDVIFYLLRTGWQWRLLPREYPPGIPPAWWTVWGAWAVTSVV
jgi:transposase